MDMQEYSLEQVCIKITDGAHNSPPTVTQGLPMGSVKDMSEFGIDLSTCRFISKEHFDTLIKQGCQPQIGDVLIAKDGATALDTVCIIKEPIEVVLLSSIAILRPNPQLIEPYYLKLYLQSEPVRRYMKSAFISGAAIPRVVLKDFKRVKISIPSLQVQEKVVHIISSYDRLIENNSRRIQILEEMAQAIYRKWFVHFRYPGHEGVRFVESEMGEIPEGWEPRPFSSIVDIDPQTSVKKDEEKPYIDMGQLSTNNMVVSWSQLRKDTSGSKFINRDVLFPRITPCVENGKNGFVQCLPEGTAGIGSTEFIVFREKVLPAELVYFISRDSVFRENAIRSMVGASGRQRVRKECFDTFFVAVPPEELLAKFKVIAEPIFKAVQNLANKNANLRQQRGLLLPRLVSGEIDID